MRPFIAGLLLTSGFVAAGQASIITEKFTGTVSPNYYNGGPAGSVFAPTIGSSVSGTITFDTAAMVSQPGNTPTYNGGISMTVTDVNGTQSAPGALNSVVTFQAQINPSQDQISAQVNDGSIFDLTQEGLVINFSTGTFKTETPSDLPFTLTPGAPPGSNGYLTTSNRATLTSLGFDFDIATFVPAGSSPGTAPEPSTIGLFVLAGAGLFGAGPVRARKAH